MAVWRGPRLVVAMSVVGAAIALTAGCGAPDEVVRVARSGLEGAVPGIVVGEESGSAVEGRCALVQFETSRGIDKVALTRDASGSWVMSRIATDADYFDIDSGWLPTGCTP